jgi:hypothetical protein
METSPATVTPPETDLGGGVVTDEGVVAKGVASGLGELVPDVEPLTVVLVDLLTTDLNLDGGDESVTDEWRADDDTSLLDGGHLNAQVHAVDQITVTGDGRGHLLTEADGSENVCSMDSVSVTTVTLKKVI